MTTLTLILLIIFGFVLFVGIIRVLINPSNSVIDLFLEILLIDLLIDLLSITFEVIFEILGDL